MKLTVKHKGTEIIYEYEENENTFEFIDKAIAVIEQSQDRDYEQLEDGIKVKVQ